MTETGEEGEYSTFQGRGRLYHFVNGSWTEKGSGVIKLNTVYDLPEEDEHGEHVPIDIHVARLIMRAAATHKVILNARVFKEMRIGDQEGNEPKGKSLVFSVPVDGKLVPHQLKVYIRSICLRMQAANVSNRWARMERHNSCINLSSNCRQRCRFCTVQRRMSMSMVAIMTSQEDEATNTSFNDCKHSLTGPH